MSTISARIRAVVLAKPLTRDQIVNMVGGNRKSQLHYIAKLLDRGMLVRVSGSGRDCLIGPGRAPYVDFALSPEEKAIRLKARNAKHNALKKARRALVGKVPRIPQTPEQRAASRRAAWQRRNARLKAARAAARAQSTPKPPKARKPAPKPAQAARRTKMPAGMIDCAHSKPAPKYVPPDTEAFMAAHPERVTRYPTPPPSPWITIPARRAVAGARA